MKDTGCLVTCCQRRGSNLVNDARVSRASGDVLLKEVAAFSNGIDTG
jgi:hypothetical protein